MVPHGGWHNDTQITVAYRDIPRTYCRPCVLPKEFMYERSDYRALTKVVLDDENDLEIRRLSLGALDLDKLKYQSIMNQLSAKDEIRELVEQKIQIFA